jgi:hypothetical protein
MRRFGSLACGAVALTVLSGGVAAAAPSGGGSPSVAVEVYDDFSDADGYTLDDYLAKWSNIYGPGEMAAGGTRTFTGGTFTADAAPFMTGADFSVYDHIKYLAVSNETFPIPQHGSVQFALDVAVETPGTEPGRIVHGTYADGTPYAEPTLEGQQAAATLHMIDFETGQLFDWFVSGSTAFTLVERLPATVTGSPAGATVDTMYTQIIDEVQLSPGTHNVAIEFTRNPGGSFVEYRLDGQLVSKVHRVGIPLDVQGARYTGIYPSLGGGELVSGQMDSVAIGHGLFSLLDAFPFQHPDAPDLAVSIPLSERLFGQGATATFDNVVVTTTTPGAP